MTETLGKLSRLQRTTSFKYIASGVILFLAIAFLVTYIVNREAAKNIEAPAELEAAARTDTPDRIIAERELANLRLLNGILARSSDPTAVIWMTVAVTGVMLALIWLGLGLTGLGVITLLLGVAMPLELVVYRQLGARWALSASRLIMGLGALGMSFFVLMEIVKFLLSGRTPVVAIARNVVIESVRLKVSLVFIVLLLFGLTALPGLLDPTTPLRYRVQSFLSYGTGGSFWLVAILTVFLSVATVAFEQRERVIWQTMTKPVAAWQYILGKWIGVAAVSGMLLLVATSGVFLFTEYLRLQPAKGEISAYQADESSRTALTEDRRILETQVLAARTTVLPDIADLDPKSIQEQIDNKLRLTQQEFPDFKLTKDIQEQWVAEINSRVAKDQMSIGTQDGEYREFTFTGLQEARNRNVVLTIRYRINAGSNDPKTVFRLTFLFRNHEPISQEASLNTRHAIDLPASVLTDDGTLSFKVINGEMLLDQSQRFMMPSMNPETVVFPPGDLEVAYSAGSYRANFMRVVLILWFKLAAIAMLGIMTATSLSFSVASLVAFGVFLAAESARFLWDSLDYYDAKKDGELIIHRRIVQWIAYSVSGGLKDYADLKPTQKLVDGRLIPTTDVATAAVILGAVTVVLFTFAVFSFRRRELAIYSGN